MPNIIKKFDEFRQTNEELFSSLTSSVGKLAGKAKNLIKGKSNQAFQIKTDDNSMGREILSAARNINASSNISNPLDRIHSPANNWYYFFTEIDGVEYRVDSVKHIAHSGSSEEEYTVSIKKEEKDKNKYPETTETPEIETPETPEKPETGKTGEKQKLLGAPEEKKLLGSGENQKLLNSEEYLKKISSPEYKIKSFFDEIIDITTKKLIKIKEIQSISKKLKDITDSEEYYFPDEISEKIREKMRRIEKLKDKLSGLNVQETRTKEVEENRQSEIRATKRMINEILNRIKEIVEKHRKEITEKNTKKKILLNQSNESIILESKYKGVKLNISKTVAKLIFQQLEKKYKLMNPKY
jgi:predicted  nucleic acid-binding Zn-ribbon protein